MALHRLCVFGGTGFVGRHLLAALGRRGLELVVPTRHPQRHRDLALLPGVRLEAWEPGREAQRRALLAGCDAAVNLVGILNERRRGDFQRVHVELAQAVARDCVAAGVPRLLHMSALNAHVQAPSAYLRSKGEGEERVHAVEGLAVTSFRPSVIFGPGDGFFNRFAGLLRLAPLVFPLACPRARLAPVYVGDVVRAHLWALDRPEEAAGRRLELCGPHSYTLEELVRYTARLTGYRGRILPLGPGLSRLQALVLGHLPGRPFTLDNLRSLSVDAVCREPAELGFTPTAVEAVVPGYLGPRAPQRRLDRWRRGAARP